ncbi:MAG: hypothetical protein AMXMBFR33_41680 [Candidatus Xenobia bacterium]|jgi:acyl-coenzyme A thioesterase PaaI-like protein
MAFELENPIATLRQLWSILRRVPLGRQILSFLFGFFVPYTGSIRPEIIELEPGLVKIRMRDRRAVRNHLRSIHAMALGNLAEAATGLAVSLVLSDDRRAILTGFRMDYLKKGRGPLTAVCRFQFPPGFGEGDLVVEGEVHNRAGETVAVAHANWRVSAR